MPPNIYVCYTHLQANKLSLSFAQIGLKRGDTIGIWSPNTANWYVMMIAIAKAGLVSVAMNPAYQAPEIAYCIKKVDMKAIFAFDTYKTQNYYDILSKVVPEIKYSRKGEIRSKEFLKLSTVIIDTDRQLRYVVCDGECLIT